MKNIKTVTISTSIIASSNFTFKLSTIPFIPTSMVIKNINYLSVDPDIREVIVLWSDLTNDTLCSFKIGDNTNSLVEYYFPISGNILGTNMFRFRTVSNVQYFMNGQFAITIEFRG